MLLDLYVGIKLLRRRRSEETNTELIISHHVGNGSPSAKHSSINHLVLQAHSRIPARPCISDCLSAAPILSVPDILSRFRSSDRQCSLR